MPSLLALPALLLGWSLAAPLLQLPGPAVLLPLSSALADSDDDRKGKDHKERKDKHHKHGDDDDDERQGESGPPPGPPSPPELLVATSYGGDAPLIEAAGFVILARDRLDLIGGELLRVRAPAGIGPEQARDRLQLLAPGSLIDFNTLYRPEEFGCDSQGCRAFQTIGWPALPGDCGAAPLIGMLDTSVNAAHPALAGQLLEIVPLLADGREPASEVHGTAIAALLVGRADAATPGLLPRARLIAVEAFHSDAAGNASADAFDLLRGLDLLAQRQVDVVNMSFAGPPNLVLQQALAAAHAAGIGLVAAAGNDGPAAPPLYPGAYEGVLAVTAVDGELNLFSQAASGPQVAFAAPGVRLWTAASVSGGRFRSGTSYAAPFVTAALAVERARQPARSLDALIALLAGRARDLGPPGRDPQYGWGLLQAPCDDGAD